MSIVPTDLDVMCQIIFHQTCTHVIRTVLIQLILNVNICLVLVFRRDFVVASTLFKQTQHEKIHLGWS